MKLEIVKETDYVTSFDVLSIKTKCANEHEIDIIEKHMDIMYVTRSFLINNYITIDIDVIDDYYSDFFRLIFQKMLFINVYFEENYYLK